MTPHRHAVQTAEDAQALLAGCGHFHDWFLLEVRSLSPVRFSNGGATFPAGGRSLALRLASGYKEVTLWLGDVSRFSMGSGPDAIQGAEITIATNGEVTIRLDDIVATARAAAWSDAPYTSSLKLGPALPIPDGTAWTALGGGWVQCPACGEAWQPRWEVELCPSCGSVVSDTLPAPASGG